MCQLLGMNANTPTDVMFSFAGLATRAAEHKDGFGIAFFEDSGLRLFVDHQSARQSPVAELVKHWPIRSSNVIAHIRKATQGRVALRNTHPFVRELWGHFWVFAHNGDLASPLRPPQDGVRPPEGAQVNLGRPGVGLKGFAPRLHASFHPVGDTDSELAFCWLLQELAKAHAAMPSVTELTRTLAELLPLPAAHGTFNCLLSNGQALWAHCSTQLHWLERRHPFGAAHLADDDVQVDFAALTSPADRVALVATQPLTRGEAWTAMAPGELRVFVDGVGSAAGAAGRSGQRAAGSCRNA